MAKKKGLSYEEKMLNALEKLPNPIIDKKHNLRIYIIDDRVRSNQSRFEHIIESRHGLRPSDIERIPRYIKKCFLEEIKRGKKHLTSISKEATSERSI